MYSGEGREGEKGASLVQETPHHRHHHHHERWAQHRWDLVGRETPAVSRTTPQPAPSTPAWLLVLWGLALLSQQAMEMVLVRQFNKKLGETSRVYHSNFFFSFSKRRKKFSCQEMLLMPVLTASEPCHANPGDTRARLSLQTLPSTLQTMKPSTHTGQKQFTPFFWKKSGD